MHGMQEVIGSTPIYSTKRGSQKYGPFLLNGGVVAHLVEHLVRNQKVVGSSPIYSTAKGLPHRQPLFLYSKQRLCRKGGLLGHLLQGDAAQVGHPLCHQWQVGTLVALAAVRHGAQIGGVGLEQQAL